MTKEALRCNVIVGEIVRLEIETTTRLLYLEDSPEELIVRGFDGEGKKKKDMLRFIDNGLNLLGVW